MTVPPGGGERTPPVSPVERRIYGVDFSGAKEAGKHIWVTSGVMEGDALRIDDCHRGDTLPGSSRQREPCLVALRALIVGESRAAFGLDFPFGLPAPLVDEDSWESFVLAFPDLYGCADGFREACRQAGAGSELKRVTDRDSQTPLSPYNLRLYRQTYHGIRGVLHPLVRDQAVCVLPMQEPLLDRSWVLEVCPASTLKAEGLYDSYKGRERQKRETRERILEGMEEKGLLVNPHQAMRAMLVGDAGGDALDSVIAALATARALRRPDGLVPSGDDNYAVEGYVYV